GCGGEGREALPAPAGVVDQAPEPEAVGLRRSLVLQVVVAVLVLVLVGLAGGGPRGRARLVAGEDRDLVGLVDGEELVGLVVGDEARLLRFLLRLGGFGRARRLDRFRHHLPRRGGGRRRGPGRARGPAP